MTITERNTCMNAYEIGYQYDHLGEASLDTSVYDNVSEAFVCNNKYDYP